MHVSDYAKSQNDPDNPSGCSLSRLRRERFWPRRLIQGRPGLAAAVLRAAPAVALSVSLAAVACAAQPPLVVPQTPALVAPPAEPANLPRVVIVATGGTIAGTTTSVAPGAYQAARLGVDALIAAVPDISHLARVTGEQLCQVASQNMSDEIWLRLARRLNELTASDAVDGVVITHGTDTIEETAYFLNLVVATGKPVVFTGAMRPATALSADGPLNLFNAVAVAASATARDRGVLVVMNDVIHGAREVTKINTIMGQELASPIAGPVGAVHYGEVRFFRPTIGRHTSSSTFRIDRTPALPRVDILYAHASMAADLIDASVRSGARGIVIAGTGTGNMTDASIASLARAVSQGVVAVRSTRMGSGIVLRNQEIDDDRLGFVAADALSPQKARVLLQLALLRTKDRDAIQRLFLAY